MPPRFAGLAQQVEHLSRKEAARVRVLHPAQKRRLDICAVVDLPPVLSASGRTDVLLPNSVAPIDQTQKNRHQIGRRVQDSNWGIQPREGGDRVNRRLDVTERTGQIAQLCGGAPGEWASWTTRVSAENPGNQ